jgi:hypothetical protein
MPTFPGRRAQCAVSALVLLIGSVLVEGSLIRYPLQVLRVAVSDRPCGDPWYLVGMPLCSYPVNDPADEFGPRVERCPPFGALVNLSLPPVYRPHRREVMRACAQSVSDRRAGETVQPFRIGCGVKGMGLDAHLVVVDEFAFFSATVGTETEREKFNLTARDVAARGRKCAVWLILATQRPSSQIVDTALRDLFGYRCAFRCTTSASSDIVLGHGWAADGYDAKLIDPLARGVAWLLAEDGLPRRIKVAYLDDGQVAALARRAALLRGRE